MRILVIEDEIKLAHAIKRALELQKYAVDVSYDGQDGYDLALTEEYDLVLLDVMLPNMSGTQICTELRNHKISTPLIILTAKGLLQDKVYGLDCGADDYMVKPFAFEELFSRIRALVRRSSQSAEPLLQVGDLTLEPAAFKVQRAEKTIALSTKEFAILEYLLRNKNKIVSKDQIIRHVWDYQANVLPSTVEVHMKNLRDKIDKPFLQPLILTHRGFGYEVRDEK